MHPDSHGYPPHVPPPRLDPARHLAAALDGMLSQHSDEQVAAALDRLDDAQLARLRRCLNAVGRY